jgi:hypothetical protein
MLTFGTLLGGPLTIGIALAVLRVGSVPARPANVPQPAAATTVARVREISFAGERGPRVGAPSPDVRVVQVGESGAPARDNDIDAVPVVRLTPLPTEPVLAVAESSAPEGLSPARTSGTMGPGQTLAARAAGSGDLLTREASLVAEGRTALRRGDATRALAAIHAAQALASHQLAPEELAVEIQSLHALGREREAVQAEVVLKVSYPESDLSR